ncbi:MAG: DNRLRE domain-containing protein [Verrucomicrobiota bacterium]
MRCGFLWAGLWLVPNGSLHSASIVLPPVADTSLSEFSPNNNSGGNPFVIAGTSGMNSGGTKNRGLYRFDLSLVPPGSKIKSAALKLEVTSTPSNGGEMSTFTLHRMEKNWGEGIQNSSATPSPGLGLPAMTNEATWNSPFAFTTNLWTGPGASNDFVATISSSAAVFGLSDFPEFVSTPEMVSDVQLWLDNASLNFGWLLKTMDEDLFFSARRFGSREFAAGDPNSPPYLAIEFIPPPNLAAVGTTGGQFHFSFFAEAGQGYTVQFKTNLMMTDSWSVLTNVAAPVAATNVMVSDSIAGEARFYRVVAP